MKKTILWLFVLSFSILSCDEIADNGNTETKNAQAGVTSQTPSKTNTEISPQKLEKLGQVVSCNAINKKIAEAADATWTKSPFQVALKFAGDQMESRKKVIVAESLSGGENFDQLIITVEEDGLLDDSVGGSMLILRMEKKGTTWDVTKASKVWKCWPGRGHVGYSSEPCS